MNDIPKTVKTYTVKCPVCEGTGSIEAIQKEICETCKGRGVIEILNR